MLMQREKITAVHAFAMLTRASQDTQIKLVDVARWLVEEHKNGITRD
jgi:AmiR/NasT family two-component response regulator